MISNYVRYQQCMQYYSNGACRINNLQKKKPLRGKYSPNSGQTQDHCFCMQTYTAGFNALPEVCELNPTHHLVSLRFMTVFIFYSIQGKSLYCNSQFSFQLLGIRYLLFRYDQQQPRMQKHGESKTTQIMMANVRHMTSSSGLRKFYADGFLLD